MVDLVASSKVSLGQRKAARALATAFDHPAAMYVASLASGSRRSTIYCLKKIAGIFAATPGELVWEKLTFTHVSTLRSLLAERYAPSTANSCLAALRGVLKFAVRLELMTRDAMLRAIDVKRVRGERLMAGRSLSKEELSKMFAAARARGDQVGVRDRAMLALLYGCGLRRVELGGLDLVDLESADGQFVSLVVRGKGNKVRRVPVPASAGPALVEWATLRGDVPGPFFYRYATGHQRTLTARLTGDGIYAALLALAKLAGVEHFSPHDLRRTYVGDLLEAGVDLATVQQLAGHASPTTTAGYDRRPLARRKEAADKLEIPLGE